MGILKTRKLENWLNVPAIMRIRKDEFVGILKYGVRIPMKSSTTPLQEYEVGSRERVYGVKPGYWFVSEDESIKVRLITAREKEDELKGIGRDSSFFKYSIRRR